MANGISYNSEEVFDTQNALQKSIDLLQREIEGSVNNDFNVLDELGLFYDGMGLVKKQVAELNDKSMTLLKELQEHDQEMNEFEESQVNFVHSFIKERESNSHYTGEYVDTKSIDLDDVKGNNKLEVKPINQILVDLSYEDIVTILKKILKENGSSILFDKTKYNILKVKLESILKETQNKDIKLSDDENIQKALLEYINGNSDLREELDDDFIKGLPYLNKYAKNNDIELYDLVAKEENSDKFIDALKELYYTKNNDILTEDEIYSVNTYLENIAKDNRISINELLSNKENIKLIKGGVIDDSNS